MSAALDDIVSVNITIESAATSRQGFTTPLLLQSAAHANFAERLKLYGGSTILADLLDDGFIATDDAYEMAEKALAQTPRPSRLYIGRRDAGDVAINDAVTAIRAENDTDWYGLAVGTRTEADILAIALQIEGSQHLYAATSADAAITAQTAGNVLEDLNGFGYRRTNLIPHYPASEDWIDAAMIARAAAADLDVRNGNLTWANKNLVGVTADTFTTAERTYIHGLNGTTYERRGGRDITREGKSVHGEYMDVQVGVDWLDARLTEDVFALLANTSTMIGLDQAGIDAVEMVVRRRLQIAVDNGVLISFTLTVPKFEDLLSADKAARLLRTIEFEGVIRGAIHTVRIVGRVSV
jgi:hypothetical protein